MPVQPPQAFSLRPPPPAALCWKAPGRPGAPPQATQTLARPARSESFEASAPRLRKRRRCPCVGGSRGCRWRGGRRRGSTRRARERCRCGGPGTAQPTRTPPTGTWSRKAAVGAMMVLVLMPKTAATSKTAICRQLPHVQVPQPSSPPPSPSLSPSSSSSLRCLSIQLQPGKKKRQGGQAARTRAKMAMPKMAMQSTMARMLATMQSALLPGPRPLSSLALARGPSGGAAGAEREELRQQGRRHHCQCQQCCRRHHCQYQQGRRHCHFQCQHCCRYCCCRRYRVEATTQAPPAGGGDGRGRSDRPRRRPPVLPPCRPDLELLLRTPP
mmetsp:Transcript_1689/g.3576  ORF Transcript_1689/g.3576 Transcript_1689/m.3576 type:complete len:327 (+) Transcript_1689:386-1366(+)